MSGTALRAGHFLIHGVKAPIAQIDCSAVARLTPPFERAVHGFTWLADLEACAPRAQCTPTAERVLTAWLEANPQARQGRRLDASDTPVSACSTGWSTPR